MEPTSLSKAAPPLVLGNPYSHIPAGDREKIQANICRLDHKYLILRMLPHKNVAQCLISNFIIKLIAECRKRELPEFYDETNESRIAQILLDLNFTPHEPTSKSTPKRRTPTGRPNRSVAKPTEQPGTSQRDAGAAD